MALSICTSHFYCFVKNVCISTVMNFSAFIVYLLSSIQFVLWHKGVPYITLVGSVLFLRFYKPIIWVKSLLRVTSIIVTQLQITTPKLLNTLLPLLLLSSLPCMLMWNQLHKEAGNEHKQRHADACLHMKVLLRLLVVAQVVKISNWDSSFHLQGQCISSVFLFLFCCRTTLLHPIKASDCIFTEFD